MRRVLLWLLVLLAVAIASCGPGSPAPQASGGVRSALAASHRTGAQAQRARAEPPPFRLLFVGASVTAGWYASTPDRAYPALVAGRLRAGGRAVRLHVVATPGATAEEAE